MPTVVKPRRPLNEDAVVEAALRMADEGGLEALSLRRLAKVLGVTPMAIYRHVRDKDHLLDLMADRLLQQIELPADEMERWADALRRVGHSLLAVIESHPAASFLLARPFASPYAYRLAEAILAVLERAGFDRLDAVRLLQILTGMILGPAIHRASYRAAWRAHPPGGYPELSEGGHPPADQTPHLAAAADQLEDWSSGPEADRITVDLWVGGVEALASRQGSGRASPRGAIARA
jgi:TetR/AcrR family transcriptional regulator, tetracycline repressor protein